MQVAVACIAILGGCGQSFMMDGSRTSTGEAFVCYWVAISMVAALGLAIDITYRYFRQSNSHQRRVTRQTLAELVPYFSMAALVTYVLYRGHVESLHLLPGLWCIFLGLAVYSIRQRFLGFGKWIALFYLVCGIWNLALGFPIDPFSPFRMALPFGIGHVLSAGILLRASSSSEASF